MMKVYALVAMMALIGVSSAYRTYPSLQSCPELKSRFQQVSYSISEMSEVIESKVRNYDNVFTQLPKSKSVICSVKAALQELKSVLEYCRSHASSEDKIYLIEKWVRKLDALINFGHSLCHIISNPGPELDGVSETITSFLHKIKQVKQSVKDVQFSDCNTASSMIDSYEQQVEEIKRKYHHHTSSLSNLFGTRGRFLDGTKIGGDVFGKNNVSLSILNSYLQNSNLNYGNKKQHTVNNYGPRPQPFPGPEPFPDQQQPGGSQPFPPSRQQPGSAAGGPSEQESDY